jgi:hypothetical protein
VSGRCAAGATSLSTWAANTPVIELEKHIVAARATARPAETSVMDWQAAGVVLEHEHWRLVDPEPIDDLLGELN